MRSLLLLVSVLFLSLNAFTQSKTAINIHLDRLESSLQPNLPDSTFDLVGSFDMSDSVNVSKMIISVRENFGDTVSPSSYLAIDTVNMFQQHLDYARTGNTVNFTKNAILSYNSYFFQVDFYDFNNQRIGRTIKQF